MKAIDTLIIISGNDCDYNDNMIMNGNLPFWNCFFNRYDSCVRREYWLSSSEANETFNAARYWRTKNFKVLVDECRSHKYRFAEKNLQKNKFVICDLDNSTSGRSQELIPQLSMWLLYGNYQMELLEKNIQSSWIGM